MKGTIVKCLEDLVVAQFGQDKWKQALEGAGLDTFTVFWPRADFDDELVLELVGSVCETLNVSLAQAADAFGDYWVNVYSQKMYPLFYEKHKTAREFLLDLDDLHVQMTNVIENARPPHFRYEWQDDKTLIMHYQSHRGLVDFAVGLARGVGRRYGEDLQVSKLGSNKVRVVFV